MKIENDWIGIIVRAAALHALCACETPADEPIAEVARPGEGVSAAAPARVDAATPQANASGATQSTGVGQPSSAQMSPRTGGTAVSPDGGSSTSLAGDLPCDVRKILAERCGTCHGKPAAFGAPMSLTTLADFKTAGPNDASMQVAQLVKTRINATTKAMPPPTSSPLMAAERDRLNAWLDEKTPPGTQACAEPPNGSPSGTGQPVDVTGLDCHKFVAHAQGDKKAKYKVGVAVDSYVNMAFKAGWQGIGYAAVIRPVVDNTKAIHHWLMYEEAATDGSITSGIGQHPNGNLMAGWAPGGPIYDFRKFGDVGLEMPGTTYVLEIHYNSNDASAEDASGVEICMMKGAPKNIVTNSWLGYDNFILAGDLGGPREKWTGTCVPKSREPIHILYVTPHMHKTGRHMNAVINQPGGSKRTLHDKAFEFEYQSAYEKNEVLMPGETITTTCTFSQPMSFGQGTNDEMCYLFTYAYPKGALVDDGPWGTFAHGEGVCLGQ
jgi:hypothetical protein